MFKACQEIYLGSTSGDQNSVFGKYQQKPDDGMFIFVFSLYFGNKFGKIKSYLNILKKFILLVGYWAIF